MIGFIFIGTLLGWIAAGAALVSGAGVLLALALCPLVGCGATLVGAGLGFLVRRAGSGAAVRGGLAA
jgi:hypothetical protein